MNVVFVGGVHGVGKSTACEHVARAHGYSHISASELIRRERADAIAVNGKLVADIHGNQELLIRGCRRFLASGSSACVLLDGLRRPETIRFQSVTLEDCVEASHAIGDEETASAFHHRYLDFERVERAILGPRISAQDGLVG